MRSWRSNGPPIIDPVSERYTTPNRNESEDQADRYIAKGAKGGARFYQLEALKLEGREGGVRSNKAGRNCQRPHRINSNPFGNQGQEQSQYEAP